MDVLVRQHLKPYRPFGYISDVPLAESKPTKDTGFQDSAVCFVLIDKGFRPWGFPLIPQRSNPPALEWILASSFLSQATISAPALQLWCVHQSFLGSVEITQERFHFR